MVAASRAKAVAKKRAMNERQHRIDAAAWEAENHSSDEEVQIRRAIARRKITGGGYYITSFGNGDASSSSACPAVVAAPKFESTTGTDIGKIGFLALQADDMDTSAGVGQSARTETPAEASNDAAGGSAGSGQREEEEGLRWRGPSYQVLKRHQPAQLFSIADDEVMTPGAASTTCQHFVLNPEDEDALMDNKHTNADNKHTNADTPTESDEDSPRTAQQEYLKGMPCGEVTEGTADEPQARRATTATDRKSVV